MYICIHQPILITSQNGSYNEYVLASKNFIRIDTDVKGQWLIDVAPHYWKSMCWRGFLENVKGRDWVCGTGSGRNGLEAFILRAINSYHSHLHLVLYSNVIWTGESSLFGSRNMEEWKSRDEG